MIVNSTQSFFNSMQDSLNHTMREMTKISEQVTSGELYNNMDEIDKDGKLEVVLSLQETFSLTKSYITTNKIIQSKMELQAAEMDNIIDTVEFIKSHLILNQSAVYLDSRLDIVALNALAQIGTSLNAQYGGDYLFSGSKTATKPLGDITDLKQIYNYYGNEEPLYLQTSDNLSIQYNNLNANKKEFRELFQTLHDIREACDPYDSDKMAELQNKIGDSIKWLIEEKTALLENTRIVSTTVEHQEKSQEFLEGKLTELIYVDEKKFAELSTTLFAVKRALEAQFLLINALKDLHLAKYL